jgi:hypothetical protein
MIYEQTTDTAQYRIEIDTEGHKILSAMVGIAGNNIKFAGTYSDGFI